MSAIVHSIEVDALWSKRAEEFFNVSPHLDCSNPESAIDVGAGPGVRHFEQHSLHYLPPYVAWVSSCNGDQDCARWPRSTFWLSNLVLMRLITLEPVTGPQDLGWALPKLCTYSTRYPSGDIRYSSFAEIVVCC
jgi:hypothetical protein